MSAIPVIVNATAGGGWTGEALEALEGHFRAAGLEAEILPARSGEEMLALARKVASANPPILVAGGGDGTISTVASIVQSTGTALGVLPLGTLNHFAKDLGIPLAIEDAIRVLAVNRQTQVDVGQVNERVFINNSSLGIYPDIVRDRRRQQRRLGRGKQWAMLWATLTALRRSPFLRVALRVQGEERHYRAPFVFVGNNVYNMEGFEIGTRTDLTQGRLSIYVTQHRGRLGLVALGFRALFGRLRQARDFEAMTAQQLDVQTRHRYLSVATDGEVTLMKTPLHYRSLPGALRVIVP
jgi:diacylglycerol kinase family enzyme